MTDFKPRFVAYARSHGREPEQQVAYDRERYPGGWAAGFMVWIGRRWDEWDAETGFVGVHTQWAHQQFDAWLNERTDRLYATAERLANDPGFLAELIACERRLASGDDLGPGLTADEFSAKYLGGVS